VFGLSVTICCKSCSLTLDFKKEKDIYHLNQFPNVVKFHPFLAVVNEVGFEAEVRLRYSPVYRGIHKGKVGSRTATNLENLLNNLNNHH
jgi:hypothetical protein